LGTLPKPNPSGSDIILGKKKASARSVSLWAFDAVPYAIREKSTTIFSAQKTRTAIVGLQRERE